MEMVIDDNIVSEEFLEQRELDMEKHLKNADRRDLLVFCDDDFDVVLSAEDCVKILLEKYPVKKISTRVYKPNESSDRY